MIARPLELDGVLEIIPRKIGDDRGFFSEAYNAKTVGAAGISLHFVQDNHSFSAAKGVLRGLHYQLPPYTQDKLVRVIRGAILDVAVDIRKSSPTFGKWMSLEVSEKKWNQILVPKGFAHGFITLVENTEVIYKVTDYYAPAHDRTIRFDDPAIGIDWPISPSEVQLSEKDRNAPLLADAEVFA
ncbi:dTDP-4-dehydrorhamnose 3,5-epimerase [Brucella pseudogrignonensis]|jgi:dTDP-4-dehydrorhamnose 3,5-epimerase|uniref:dTDP-4-dehydrorhamnose 3,5-epimerase n=1 Tax=Brucella pseudogrignonensis TaxID=419475 RepID=A0A256G452_9HYPH|nr:dTDP-4-dehydrorhamnose 3,5-epimerase [Brucella pseudogrignonensis]NNV18883.1 dTDP-4-dehydrorhamnose 3,5-epimerase [Brucella pseudogrignonensis]OYR21877.1 dTDP-4-dehydrorhamnose 3,5-epimerase [Brucella pseudogrignonensis]